MFGFLIRKREEYNLRYMVFFGVALRYYFFRVFLDFFFALFDFNLWVDDDIVF